MRNLLLIIAFIGCSICASAQKVYFIYLQTDNSGPFYVKMNDKIYSSASSGYLILPNLVDSTYNFSIGFPSSQSESRFTVVLGGKEHGFLIKNFESGLGLFDLQSLTITNAQKDESSKNISYIRRDDEFSSRLSKAAKDTTLLYAVVRVREDNATIKKEEPKQTVVETVLNKDTSIIASAQTGITLETKKPDSTSVVPSVNEVKKEDVAVISGPIKEEPKKDTIVFAEQNEQPKQLIDSAVNETSIATEKKLDTTFASEEKPIAIFKQSRVRKHSESSTSEGFGLVYYDNYDGGSDTIRLLIPNPPIIFKQQDQDSSLVQKDFIHVDELKRDTMQQTPIVVAVKNNLPAKTQCKSIASNNDFFKLRKNMASENTDEGMVSEAKKFFKSKCFTAEQIKNLSALFLTSAGKYQFFDAAYFHVSDQENFSLLESEIKDDYYLKRFKTLIGE
jgi:hypothetical protein